MSSWFKSCVQRIQTMQPYSYSDSLNAPHKASSFASTPSFCLTPHQSEMYLFKTILVAKVKKTALTTRRRRTAFSKMRSCHVERVIIHATDNSPFFESFEQVKHHGRRLPIFTLVFLAFLFIYMNSYVWMSLKIVSTAG